MPVKNRFAEMHPEITAWRRDLHENPEILFETHRTAAMVAEKLREFGCDEVVPGIGRTGVVGVIHGKTTASGKVVGLRADMDALPFTNKPTCPMPAKRPARCMPVAMTVTPPCCWGRPNIWPKPAISTAPPWLSSNPQKRAAVAGAKCAPMA